MPWHFVIDKFCNLGVYVLLLENQEIKLNLTFLRLKRVILILFLVIVVIQGHCGVVLSNLGYRPKKVKLLAILA